MITNDEYYSLIEKIHYLERENQLLKEQIELYKKLQLLNKESQIQFIPQFVPYYPNFDPDIPTITYCSTTNQKTGDA